MKTPGALEGLYPLIPPPGPDPDFPWATVTMMVGLLALGMVLWGLPPLRHRRRLRRLARQAATPCARPRALLGELEALTCRRLATPRLSASVPPAGATPDVWRDWLTALHTGRFGRQPPDAAVVGRLIATAKTGWTARHG